MFGVANAFAVFVSLYVCVLAWVRAIFTTTFVISRNATIFMRPMDVRNSSCRSDFIGHRSLARHALAQCASDHVHANVTGAFDMRTFCVSLPLLYYTSIFLIFALLSTNALPKKLFSVQFTAAPVLSPSKSCRRVHSSHAPNESIFIDTVFSSNFRWTWQPIFHCWWNYRHFFSTQSMGAFSANIIINIHSNILTDRQIESISYKCRSVKSR